ncbi:hypothetical protein ACWEVD_19725 [Nocardia thailandica]|uniref:Uncharacterized protein n=1 Tax=Nocardia thailandica TaxID=257275 RepID=A0ABW6PX74_9NOCA|nr:hypothetical protein [Nocardia thailandica]
MPEEKRRTEDDEKTREPRGGRPGPADEGRDGGMATRELAPELAATENAQEPPD